MMFEHASLRWKRLRRYLAADPGRFAAGSAVSDPLGLLAVEREQLAEQRRAASTEATGTEGELQRS